MKNKEDIKRELNTLRFVWKMSGGEHGKIVIVMILKIFTAILPAGIAYLVKTYIDKQPIDFTGTFKNEDLVPFLSVIVCGIILKLLSDLLMGRLMPKIKQNIEISCIKKFASLPHSYIIDCIDNRIIMSLSIESGMITNLIPMVYRSFIRAPITIVAFVVVLMFTSPVLTLICVLLISIVLAGVTLFRKRIKALKKETYEKIGDTHQYFSEWLSGYRVFVTSNASHFIQQQLIRISKIIASLSKKMATISVAQAIIIEILTIIIAVIFVFAASGSSISNRIINIGELLLFPTAILFIRNEVMNVIYGYNQLAGTESAAQRIIDVIEYPVEPSREKEKFEEIIDTLTFKDVTFSYNNTSNKIFDRANVTFKRGNVNTIIGRSGAGKTTFINLSMRLRLPSQGTILFNSKDISNITEESLLGRIALVEQEPFIFEGTLAENIFFDRQVDIKYILELLEKFELSYLAKNEFELFNTQIGQRGRQLSTGEKQRIAFIRALVKNADIIFFDEVTSNLDERNARIIIDSVHAIADEKLVICVSNDIMFIQESSLQFEITNGKIECVKR